MSTYKELVYMVLDELKLISDDATFTEEHIIFLLNNYRTFILKQRYDDIRKQIPESNYQTICLDLIEVPAIAGEPCEGGSYLRSKQEIPNTIKIGSPMVYPLDYYQGEITYVSRDRMRYVGYNKYLQNIIYTSLGPDNHLYFKSSNPQYLSLEKVKMTAVFEDTVAASELSCEDDNATCDLLDKEFPLEKALVPTVIELVVKELTGSIYKPKDPANDAADNLADIATFLRNNVKSSLQKQIEG
jgi:hypothetical protein